MGTERIERLLKLLQVLQAGQPVSGEELSRAIGVSRRTVFRDLELLSRAGLPFLFDRSTGRYVAERTTLLPPVTLTHAEAIALMLAAKNMVSRPLIPETRATASAAAKLESMLPAAMLDHLGPIFERTEFRQGPFSHPSALSDTLPILQSALARRRKIHVRYDSLLDRAVLDLVLHPYRLAYIHRAWYLIGRNDEDREYRTYKVERFLQLQILAQGFRADPEFNLERYFGNAWLMIRGDRPYHVRIRFLPKVAGNIEEVVWHKTQRTSFAPDGSLIFEVDVDGLDEISWWVLGYGDQAIVLDPPELRMRILGHARSMTAHYNGRGSG